MRIIETIGVFLVFCFVTLVLWGDMEQIGWHRLWAIPLIYGVLTAIILALGPVLSTILIGYNNFKD